MVEDENGLELILCCLEDLAEKVRELMGPRPRLLNEEESARYIGKSCAFLRLSRSDGVKAQGPDYVQIGGHIRYAIEDLDRWIDELPRRRAGFGKETQKAEAGS